MTKSGFVLKHLCILLICLSSITFSLVHYYQKSIELQKIGLLLEKQKAIELILYSYFMAHVDHATSKTIQTTSLNVQFSIEPSETSTRLTSTICFEECYSWNLIYDKETHLASIVE